MTKATRVHGQARKMWRWGRVFIPLWIGLVGLLTAAAAVDAAWHLGWGYEWNDVLGGLGMMVFGAVFWVLWNWMFKVIRFLNETLYGPEVGQDSTSNR